LLELRQPFKRDVQVLVPDFQWNANYFQQLTELLHDLRITARFAKYVYNVFDVFNSAPMFVPPGIAYMSP